MSKRGVLAVVSGFSGAGKGTLMRALLNQYNNYALSISATTRQPRGEEVHGREYFFKSVEEFERLIDQDELIEYAKYVDNYYGTPKDYVEKQLDEGKDVILEIEIQGASKVKAKYPDTVLLFVAPPNVEALKNRLIGRGTETMDVIKSRLRRATEEAEGMTGYDYLLINDDFNQCVKEMHAIIQSQHNTIKANGEFINQIGNELKVFMKGD